MICWFLWVGIWGLLSIRQSVGMSWGVHVYASSYGCWQAALALMGRSVGYHTTVSVHPERLIPEKVAGSGESWSAFNTPPPAQEETRSAWRWKLGALLLPKQTSEDV